ncbi:MAG: NADH oxidase [Novosphingobium sp.]
MTELASDGTLELRFDEAPLASPGECEVLIRLEAAPINPSDIKHMFCMLPPAALAVEGEGFAARARGRLEPQALAQHAGRIGVALPCGNEGAGLVVAAGADPAAQALIGRRVAVSPGGMFADYRIAPARDCIVLREHLAAPHGAAAWVNPLTALAMIETMRREGHQALLLTAAASSLGRMLNRLCRAEDIALVNVVRAPRQADLLRREGATQVCDTSQPDFDQQLQQAIADTGATLAFDATGGGVLAGRILRAMDRALSQSAGAYSHYGSTQHKQLYFFGGLNPEPVQFRRDFGMAWGMGGWLLQSALARFGEERVAAMKARVAGEIETTFATQFARQIPHSAILDLANCSAYMKLSSGGKFLVTMASG